MSRRAFIAAIASVPSVPVSDGPGFDEHSLADDLNLRIKAGGPSTSRFNARLNPVGVQYAAVDLAGR